MTEVERDEKIKRLIKELKMFHHDEAAKELARLWKIVWSSGMGSDGPIFKKEST